MEVGTFRCIDDVEAISSDCCDTTVMLSCMKIKRAALVCQEFQTEQTVQQICDIVVIPHPGILGSSRSTSKDGRL